MMVPVEACERTDLAIALEFLPADHVTIASDRLHYDGTPDLLSGFERAGAGRDERDLAMVAGGTLAR